MVALFWERVDRYKDRLVVDWVPETHVGERGNGGGFKGLTRWTLQYIMDLVFERS